MFKSPFKSSVVACMQSPMGLIPAPDSGYTPTGDGTGLLIEGVTSAAWAANASNTWQDSAGTLATGNGLPVGRINDLSGNGEILYQFTASTKPTLREVGGISYIETDGGDYMEKSSGIISAINTGADFSVYVAFKTGHSSVGFGSAWVQADGTAVDGNDRIAQFHSTGLHSYFKEGVGNTEYTMSVGTITTDTWYVSGMKYNSGSQLATNRLNGVTQGTLSVPNTITTATSFQLFRGNIGSLLKATAGSSIAGMAVYSGVLTPEQEAQVEAELAAMCGVSLP